MSDERRTELLEDIREDTKYIRSYVHESKSDALGKLTFTPARAMLTAFVLFGIFMVVAALVATQNQEALMQLLGMFGGR